MRQTGWLVSSLQCNLSTKPLLLGEERHTQRQALPAPILGIGCPENGAVGCTYYVALASLFIPPRPPMEQTRWWKGWYRLGRCWGGFTPHTGW